MARTKTQKEYEEKLREWELKIVPMEDWAEEEGVKLGQDKPQEPTPSMVEEPIPLTQIIENLNLDELLSEESELLNTRYAGNNRDLTTLLSGFEVLQEELNKQNEYTLRDSKSLDRYTALVTEVDDILEGIKQHHIDHTNKAMRLEQENYAGLRKKKEDIDEEQKIFEDTKETYRKVREALTRKLPNEDYDRLSRGESRLYSTLVQTKRRIDSMKRSYEADRSTNRVLNVACGNGRIAVENLSNLQRTLKDNLAMQVSALSMGTMVTTMQEVDLSSALDSGWNTVEYFHKTVDGMQPGFNTDRIYEAISAMSERAQEVDRDYRAKFGNGDF